MRSTQKRGQAFLSMVFFIGGIMVVMGITMAVVATAFIDSGYGAQAADTAEAAATSGIEDAFLQLARNSTFSSTGGYVVTSGSNSATVIVSAPVANLVTVLSTATVHDRTRKVQAVFSVSPSTGQISALSWGDIP